MKKTIYISILGSLLFTSCTIKYKEPKKKNSSGSAEQISQKPNSNNWANSYYKKTTFEVRYPTVVEPLATLSKICKGDEASMINTYGMANYGTIKYKTKPINIKTKTGFTKKVYITKGACRELVLFKTNQKKKGTKVRKKIKKMVLNYIYNERTYLETLEFDTIYSDVQMIVE